MGERPQVREDGSSPSGRRMDRDGQESGDAEVDLTRRALLVGVGVAIGGGGASVFADVAKAAAGDGPLEAGRGSFDTVQLVGTTSNPSPSSGYAALAFREDRV